MDCLLRRWAPVTTDWKCVTPALIRQVRVQARGAASGWGAWAAPLSNS